MSDKGDFELTCISRFQVIFPGIWVFALILNIPVFLVVDTLKVKSRNFCVYVWPEAWMGKAYSWTLLVFQTLIPLPLMIVLYSRVVYTLWFRGNDDNQLTHQQMVSVRNPQEFFCLFSSCGVQSTREYLLSIVTIYTFVFCAATLRLIFSV